MPDTLLSKRLLPLRLSYSSLPRHFLLPTLLCPQLFQTILQIIYQTSMIVAIPDVQTAFNLYPSKYSIHKFTGESVQLCNPLLDKNWSILLKLPYWLKQWCQMWNVQMHMYADVISVNRAWNKNRCQAWLIGLHTNTIFNSPFPNFW